PWQRRGHGMGFLNVGGRLLAAAPEDEHRFATIKGLGIAARRVRLHAAQAHQRHKCLAREPGVLALARKALEDVRDLGLAVRRLERDEYIGRPEVAVVLRDLL